MKTLFTLSSLVSVAITGIASFRLFERAHYDASALLVTIIRSKKNILQ